MKIRNQGHDKWELIFLIALSVTTFLVLCSLSTAYAVDTTPNTPSIYRDQAKQILPCCLQNQASGLSNQLQLTNFLIK